MRLFWILILPILLFGEGILKPGEPVGSKVINDQFGNAHSIGGEHYWIVTWDRATTHDANAYFSYDSSLLREKQAALIVDVSQTPSGIMSLFVLPRMKEYLHPILLSHDEVYNRTLPYKEGHITVLTLDKGHIQTITYVQGAEMLAKLLGTQK